MKRSLFIAIAVLIVMALFVGCKAEIADRDELVEVTIAGESRALQATGVFNVDINQYYWFYTATKTSGGYRTGEQPTEKAVKDGKGLTGASLGSFSKGTWEFCFYGYANAEDKETVSKRVYFQTGLRQEIKSAVSLTVTLTQGQGALPPATVEFKNPTWYHKDFETLPANQTTGYALNLKIFVGDATPEWKEVSATTVNGRATFDIADKLTLEEATTLRFRVYWDDDLVGSTDLEIPAAAGTQYTVKDLNQESGIQPVNNETYGVTIFDAIVPGMESTEVSGTISVSTQDTTVVRANVAPTAATQTIVTFPAGSFSAAGEHELTIEVADAADNTTSGFVVSDGTAIAVLSFNLDDSTTTTTFGAPVEIETYIQPGLTAGSVGVQYVGSYTGTDAQPENVEYDPVSGKLTFTVTHFSDYVVVSKKAVARIGNALYETLEAAIAAANAGDTITFIADYTVSATKTEETDRIVVDKAVTIDFGAYKLIVPGELEPTDNWAALFIEADTTFEATTGGIECLDKEADGDCGVYAANVKNNATLTIKGGSYHGGGTVVQAYLGKVIIIDGSFSATTFGAPYNYDFILNCYDANYTAGTASFEVKGGTFKNFNPSDNKAEGEHTNFVAAGYASVEKEGYFEVVPAVATIGSKGYATLAAAVEAVPTDNTETEIKLLKSVSGSGVKVVEGKNIVFNLNGNTYTVINPTVGSTGTETNAFQLLKGSKVTFKNGSLRSSVALIFLQNYCDLTLIDVDLDCSSASQMQYVVSNNFGSLTVKGNTRIIASSTNAIGVAFDVWYGMSSVYFDGVTILFDESFTGEVNGKVEFGSHGNGSALFEAAIEDGKVGIEVKNNTGVFTVTPAKSSNFSFAYTADWARSDANPFVW